MRLKIFDRYFLKEMFKVFALFLIGFYALYVMIDYSTHSRSFKNYNFSWSEIASYYAFEFIGKSEILIPFAILIACIKTLFTLNKNNELVALMSGGISLKRLMIPFLAFGLFFTAWTYFNSEVLQPQALSYHKQMGYRRSQAKQKRHSHPHIQQLILNDKTSLIFRDFDEMTDQLEDVFWVRSIDDIYRIGVLSPYASPPIGRNIEHLVRNPQGLFTLSEFIDEKAFPEIAFDKTQLIDTVTTPQDLSLTQLYEKIPHDRTALSEKEARMITSFNYKVAMPWLCLLAIIAPAPFCIVFSRNRRAFLIYALSLFGLVAFYITMDAAVVLGERQVVEPVIAIWAPFTLFFGFFGLRFLLKGA